MVLSTRLAKHITCGFLILIVVLTECYPCGGITVIYLHVCALHICVSPVPGMVPSR